MKLHITAWFRLVPLVSMVKKTVLAQFVAPVTVKERPMRRYHQLQTGAIPNHWYPLVMQSQLKTSVYTKLYQTLAI